MGIRLNKRWRLTKIRCELFPLFSEDKKREGKKRKKKRNFLVRLQIPLFSEQDNFLLKRGLRIIF